MFLLPHSVGGYSLTRKLGTGGVAESYLGTHEAGGKPVVVRRILPFVLRDPARLSSIEARIRDLLGVRHPFLVHVIDHIAEGEDHFLVEEYVNGVTLEQVLNWCRQSGHVVPHNVFLNIATQICNGLEALHGRSGRGSSAEHVLHLSIKPGSVFLSPEGKVLLGGYGLTRSPTTYPQGGVAGPVPVRMEYLSPEQTHTDQKLTPSSDVFSLGSLLYELLTLESLFRAESNLQTIHRLRRAEVTTPLLAVRDRLPGLDKVLFRALSLNPRHRYQRAFVLREDLRGLMAGYSFATIGEDTRNFLQPIFQSAAGGAESPARGYVVGLDEAPDSPAGADSFADFPTTRIDPDPMSSAALAASNLAERVARERAEDNKPERTERTEVNNDAELTPLPPYPLAAPPPEPAAAPAPPPSLSLLPPASPNDQREDTASYLPEPEPERARAPEDTSSFLAAIDPVSAESAPPSSVGKKRKGRGQPNVVLVPANPPGPTLAPAPSPLAPLGADRPLPAMSAPGRAPMPTLAPDDRSESDVVPPPASPPPAAPPSAAGATLAPAVAPAERPASPLRNYLSQPAEAPLPDEEPPPPSRAPLFAGVALLAGGAVLACAGLTYWGMLGTAEEVPPPRPEVVEATAPVVAPAEDPAAVLAAMNPEPAAAAEEAAKAAEASAKAAAEAEAKAAEAAKAEAARAEVAQAEATKAEAAKARAEAERAAAAKAEAAKAEAERAAAAKAEAARVAKASKESAARTEAARAEAAKAAKAREVAAAASAEKSARESAAAREAKARAAEEAKATAEEKARRAAEAKAEAAEKSRVAAEAKAAAAAASKAAAEEKARAAAEAKAAAARTTADASLAVVEAPPSTVLDGFVASARAGKLDATDVSTLTAVGTTDPQYTRSRALLLVDAQKRADDTAAKKYLDQLMVLPENQYNPVFLTDLARWHANHGEYERALEKAEKAERYWARLPSELVFSKKAEIYEIQAAATQGRFYKAKDDLELLERASAAWQKYRTHVATRDRSDLVKRADGELAKLADIKERLQ